MIMFWFFILSN